MHTSLAQKMGLDLWLIAGCSVLTGYGSCLWFMSFQDMPTNETLRLILGPAGALALTLVAIWALVRIMKYQQKRFDDLQNKYISTLEDQIDDLKDEVKSK